MILAVVLTMSVFTGCGKSEEEKAMDEMASHMIEEAAEDGVDLEKLLEEEYEAYEERHEENMKELEEHNDFAALMQEEVKKPVSAWEAYMASTTSEDIIANAKEYNNAYDAYLKLADNDQTTEGSLLTHLANMNPNQKRTKINESVYKIKAAYVDFNEKDNYNEAWFYYNTEEDTAHIVFQGMDETTYAVNELLVLNGDGSTCEIDLASVTTDSTSLIQSLGFIGDTYYIFTVDNAEYRYWEFDVSGKTAAGVSTATSTVTSNEHWFMNTLEELNYGEPN
jgi:hypothetical protein